MANGKAGVVGSVSSMKKCSFEGNRRRAEFEPKSQGTFVCGDD